MQQALWVIAILLGGCTLVGGDEKKAAKPPQTPPAKVARGELVAIGDVHGDFASFHKLLRKLELIDSKDHWAGGDTTLVQTGDLLDRGPEAWKAVELMIQLEREAKAAGGRVEILLGNHEVMNLTGEYQYVGAGELENLARIETAELRAKRRKEIEAVVFGQHALLNSRHYAGLSIAIAGKKFDRRFPPGFFSYLDLYAPDGKLGRWFLKKNFLHTSRRMLFVHAGLSPRYSHVPSDQLNKMLRDDLATYVKCVQDLEKLGVYDHALGNAELISLVNAEFRAGGPHPKLAPIFDKLDKVFGGLLFVADGPIWYRGLARNSERLFAESVKSILKMQNVDRIVVGHTVTTSKKIETRFDKTVIQIDTGMNSEHYGGVPSALIVDKDLRWTTLP